MRQYAKSESVSRKTKKQKLRSQSRRLEETSPISTPSTSPVNLSPSYSFVSQSSQSNPPSQAMQIAPSAKSQFSDLRKILVLTLIAICAQGVLWYLVEKGIIKLF